MSTRGRILRLLGPVALVVLVARLLQAIRDLALANQFGPSSEVDALLLAFVVPALLSSVLSGSLTAALVPARQLVRSDPSRDSALLRRVAVRGGVALVLLSVAVGALAPVLALVVANGMGLGDQALVEEMVRILAPAVLLSGAAAFGEAYVLSEGRPSIASLNQVVLAVPSALVLLFGPSALTIQTVAWAITIGFAAQAGVSIVIAGVFGLSRVMATAGAGNAVPSILGQYVAVAVASTVMALSLAMDQVMAAPLGTGAVASLSFAGKVTGFILGVMSLALSNVLLPVFSAAAADEGPGSAFQAVRRVDRWVMGISSLGAVVLVVLSAPVVQILYGHGAVSSTELNEISRLQQIQACQIPFYLGAVVQVRFLSAVRRNQALVLVGVVNVTVNFILNLILREFMGIRGIAWATVAMYVASYLMLRRAARAAQPSSTAA